MKTEIFFETKYDVKWSKYFLQILSDIITKNEMENEENSFFVRRRSNVINFDVLKLKEKREDVRSRRKL